MRVGKWLPVEKKLDVEEFSLVAPSRPVMTEWITSCWSKLSSKAINSGFARAGFLTDAWEVDIEEDIVEQLDTFATKLERYKIAEEEIASDDDIESECSGAEDDIDIEDK
ncbi:hypothetical protein GN958_ATG09780 [Phytophthora infestans]|uniref:DDE-1 domain-containing protein n=1 Tax=Phytophthora infestans TaxID=4787 RepID=A0A8S9UNC9_PHYIN|nr:hypothetical protein GN958_ATG15408 [Phytophthora infestans]KAF4140932.1 hypothetical protein GN958_ATG09780 [Phytophthora infestans]